jgi:hypothetical protein
MSFPCGHTTPNNSHLVMHNDGSPSHYERCQGCVTPEQAAEDARLQEAARARIRRALRNYPNMPVDRGQKR